MSVSAGFGDLVLAAQPTSAVGASCATMAGTTVTSRSRALTVQHAKETSKASVKDVDVVHRGVKRLETRMHDLESRVQYVNPWVVQYMWELLCELRDKIGVQYSQQRERVWLEEMRSSGRCRRGVQPMTEPRMAGCSAQHETAAAIVSVPATPMRLFDGSADGCHDGGGDDLDTSVSSESDNGDESYRVDDAVRLGDLRNREADEDPISMVVKEDGSKVRRRLTRGRQDLSCYVAAVEWRWRIYGLVQEECASRMECAMEESSQWSLLLARVGGCWASVTHRMNSVIFSCGTPTAIRCDELVQSSAWLQGQCREIEKEQRVRGRRCGMYDVPSPPNTDIPSGLSPIEPVQCPLDFFTPQTSNGGGSSAMEVNRRAGRTSSDDTDEDNGVVVRGRRMQTTGGSRETDVAVGRVLKDPAFIRKVVDEVSRQLAAQMQQSDVTKELENSPSQGLPSAVLLVVREAANAIAGAHDAEFCQRLQNYFTEQEKQREALEEQFWQRVAEHDEIWTRRVAAVQLEGAEAIQEQQRFLTLGRADAESCGEVRKELLKLCGEVIRTVERAPGNSGVPRASDDGTARQSPQGDTARQDRLELRLETLSAAVNGLYSDVEAVRKKAVVMDAPQDGWRKETEKHIATLQESMADMQEAVAIVARKSRTVEERLDTSKVEKKELHTLTERLLGLERQVESLPSLLATTAPPPLPPPNEAVTSRGSNPMSVEDAMMNAQRILFSGDERKLVLKTDPYAKAVSALCATLQQVNHLYNIGTGTFGGSLQLIFAMPPFSVPSTLASACQVYLREHSAAELKEAVEALDIGHQTAEVLLDCYYWMQSHVLVVGTGCEESLQRSRDDATVVEDLRRGLEGPLSRTGATTMPCTAPPSSAPGHGASFGDLSKSQETPLFHDMAPASGSDAATQTEKIVTALPPPLSAPQTPPPPSVNPLVTCDDGSGQSQLQRPHQHQQQNAEAAAADATTALEALAVGRSPEETESLCGVVYHYHHHHTCGEDRVHAYTPQCSGRGKSRAQNSGSQLNEHDCSEVLERRRNETVQRIESSFLDSSDAREQECPQPVPALNRSHVYRDGKRAATPGCILGAVNRTLDVAPIPSACGNECLPLPSAVSAFTDPQQVTGATGRGQRSLKNPRPFYTAITQQGRQSHRGNNDGLASDSSMRTGHCLGVEGRCEAPGRPQLHHRGLLSTTVKNRDDLLAGVMAAQLQQGPYMYHDERSPTRWRTVTRR